MNEIKQAINNHKLLRIKDLNNNQRVVEPYTLMQGRVGILLHCYQVEGYSSSGRVEGWKNIKLLDIQSSSSLGEFLPRSEFNPNKLKVVI